MKNVVLHPTRSIRRWLRRIRYYSAARPRTRWAAAIDLAPFIGLGLALPVAAAANAIVTRAGSTLVTHGVLARQGQLGWHALVTESRPFDTTRLGANGRDGVWRLEVERTRRGWPAVVTVEIEPASLTLMMVGDPLPRFDVALAADDPMRRAIETAVRLEGHTDLLAAWRDGPRIQPVWRGWVASSLVWWVAITALLVTALSLMQYGWRIRVAQRHSRGENRRASGRCPACGYDLRGLDFSERCPECGVVV